MEELVQNIGNAMSNALGAPLAVILLSVIPIAEARLAIPFGIKMGLHPAASFGYSLLGSSLIAPILILVFIPLINALSRTKVFSRLGKFLYDKFEKKSRSLAEDISDTPADGERPKKFKVTKSDMKKMGGTALFVAVPLPLTGVWTGSAVASILKIGFVKSLIGVVTGNVVACGIITLISFLFAEYVTWIVVGFAVIVTLVVIFLIVKFALYKPEEEKTETTPDREE